MGVFCCRVLTVLSGVCNFLSLSGVKDVIFLSAFRSRQAETVFPKVLMLCVLMLSGVFFSLNFTSQVLFHISRPSFKGYISMFL